jgi:hypothetical protein
MIWITLGQIRKIFYLVVVLITRKSMCHLLFMITGIMVHQQIIERFPYQDIVIILPQVLVQVITAQHRVKLEATQKEVIVAAKTMATMVLHHPTIRLTAHLLAMITTITTLLHLLLPLILLTIPHIIHKLASIILVLPLHLHHHHRMVIRYIPHPTQYRLTCPLHQSTTLIL